MAKEMPSLFVILLFAIDYNSVFTSVRGECSSDTATWSNNDPRERPISILNNTSSCLVNECTIRITESNVLLNIINITDDLIVATNNTNLFTVSVTNNDSITYCLLEDSLDDPDVNHFLFLVVITFIIIILSSLNITLHLVVKELRQSVPGFIIVGICGTIIIMYLAIIVTAVFQYLHKVNGNIAVCAVFKYIMTCFIILYATMKATYLFYFVYLMYRSYTSRPYTETNKTLLYTYIAISMTCIIFSASIIINDILGNRLGFSTHNGYCAEYFASDPTSSNYVIFIPLLAITTAVGIIFLIIGLTLYYLTTKCSCTCGGITGPKDVRVSITLISVISMGTFIFIILLLVGVGGEASVMIASISVCVEQLILLIIILTSRKSLDRLQKWFERQGAM